MNSQAECGTAIEGARYYKTATALLSCAWFKAGEIVSVAYQRTRGGLDWYYINRSQNGPLPGMMAYPHTHLTDFVL